MMMPVNPKIYHIVHMDRLSSILHDGGLFSDRVISQRANAGTMIGMNQIKHRRMHELRLETHPDLYVGDCVPFYFCPRSVMLFLIHSGRSEDIVYKGGQQPIVHLEADLHSVVNWANQNTQRWAFTKSNAGSYYFEDTNDLGKLGELRWDSIAATQWSGVHKEGKQAEFLLENHFPWHLVEHVGVFSDVQKNAVESLLSNQTHQPTVEIKKAWYY
ncbi:MAG: DUF4433 domain-containing protein [Moraxella osloensis]|nr:DUF4433 domain-containing protein [Moraxella osloensis]MBD3768074.1 DUF4433 domain-containing protein [Gammaproteobacteria bacterium]